MQRGVFMVACAFLLLGQGCFDPVTSIPLTEIEPGTVTTPDGVAAFSEGFGVLPGPAPTTPIIGERRPSMVLDAEIPAIPPEVTVLREWQTAPSTQLLRNITTSVQIPAGAFGNTPQGTSLAIDWTSADGYAWKYEAPLHALTVVHPAPPTEARDNLSPDQILGTVRAFLTAHGIDTAGWGEPEVLPPTTNDTWRVAFSASRDEQSITEGDGTFLRAGELEGVGDTVTNAMLELPRSLDRSNYPAFTQGELLQRLRIGGTNPVKGASANATLTYTEFFIVAYRHLGTVAGQPRVFYIPALYAKGLLRDGNTAIPHSTVVPLVQDRFFQKNP